jgi:hypothetical protein
MMDELLSKEKLAHILADLEAEDEIYERQKPLLEPEKIAGKVRVADMVLARSAGATIDHSLVPETTDLSFAKTDNIEKDGCQFIDAIYLFLDELGCPPDARDFVLAIAGISRGNHIDLIPMTDDQICRRMGFKRETIRKKRNALVEWERNNGWSVLEIHEKEFNHDKMKYKPTEYRVTVIPFASKFVREYRSRTSYKQGYKALENTISDEAQEIANEIAKELPDAPLVKRQQRNADSRQPSLGNKPIEKPIPFNIDSELDSVFSRWCAAQIQAGFLLRKKLETKQGRLQEIAIRHIEAQEREGAA